MNSPSFSDFVPRRAMVLLLAAAVAAPLAGRAHDGEEPELVAEALFLCDSLPPGGTDLNLSVALQPGEPDPATGAVAFTSSQRAQLAIALGDRVGLTADVGFASAGRALDTPGASLKVLIRAPAAATTGIAASLDLFGSMHSVHEVEAGAGLGALRSMGRLGLRAAASVATGVSSWTPHLHAGVSAALALGTRWRALAEVVGEVGAGGASISAGPTVKVALGDRTALMAGALFALAQPASPPAFTVQLTQSM